MGTFLARPRKVPRPPVREPAPNPAAVGRTAFFDFGAARLRSERTAIFAPQPNLFRVTHPEPLELQGDHPWPPVQRAEALLRPFRFTPQGEKEPDSSTVIRRAQFMHRRDHGGGMFGLYSRRNAMAKIEYMAAALAETVQHLFHLFADACRRSM